MTLILLLLRPRESNSSVIHFGVFMVVPVGFEPTSCANLARPEYKPGVLPLNYRTFRASFLKKARFKLLPSNQTHCIPISIRPRSSLNFAFKSSTDMSGPPEISCTLLPTFIQLSYAVCGRGDRGRTCELALPERTCSRYTTPRIEDRGLCLLGEVRIQRFS